MVLTSLLEVAFVDLVVMEHIKISLEGLFFLAKLQARFVGVKYFLRSQFVGLK